MNLLQTLALLAALLVATEASATTYSCADCRIDAECDLAYDDCESSSDNWTPDAGSSCVAVVACLESTEHRLCSYADGVCSDAYCGNQSNNACLAGTPAGPCKDVLEAAAVATGNCGPGGLKQCVAARWMNQYSGIGDAVIYRNCMDEYCEPGVGCDFD